MHHIIFIYMTYNWAYLIYRRIIKIILGKNILYTYKDKAFVSFQTWQFYVYLKKKIINSPSHNMIPDSFKD
jgi:hypothetical protein